MSSPNRWRKNVDILRAMSDRENGNGQTHSDEQLVEELNSSKTHKFRFKQNDGSREPHNLRDEHRERRHHHRSKRRKVSSREDGLPGNATSNMPQDQAFQESLFDALADDEGAAFWGGVYGQPIHEYPNATVDIETGKLETMSDEEYARFVRQRMWEKSAEGIEAARREERKKRQQKEEEEEEEEEVKRANPEKRSSRRKTKTEDDVPYNNYHFDFELEASLRRGERRREKKRWLAIWEDYSRRWDELYNMFERQKDPTTNTEEHVFLRNMIAWPVESGKRKDVSAEEVRRFINGVTTVAAESERVSSLASLIKAERVRWHPDKIQQRYGFMSVETSTMESVTAVFQILDQMWSDLR